MRVRREHGFSGFEVVVILALVALLVALAFVVHAATRRTEDMSRARRNVSTLSGVVVSDSAPPRRPRRRKTTAPAPVAPTTSATTAVQATETDEDPTPANPTVGQDTGDQRGTIPLDPSMFDDDDDRPAVPTPPAPEPQPGDEAGAEKDRP